MDEAVELSNRECRELLETDSVGRVGFVTPFGPRIVPMNYGLAGDAVELRTSIYTELARFAPGQLIVFEIDHLDSERRRGWSVVAHGRCTELEEPHVPERAEERVREPEPWAGGERQVWLRLPLDELTGRRVGGIHWPYPVVSGRGRGY
jgi:nitroimidazol reductase NimA-like FMN-containing flavoprotein (pyridoxamine 5'-phosphate oxidase superfamily)